MSTLVAHVNEMRSGWSTTKLILSLRWRMIRERKTRIVIIASGIFVFIGVLSSINLGYAIEMGVRDPANMQSQQYNALIAQLLKGVTGNIGSIFALSMFGMALLAPLAGSATISLFPAEDLQSMRPNSTHRYFDSLIVNSISGIGLLQMLTLTCLASILSIDSVRIWAMIIVWSIWALLVQITTSIGWVMEFTVRKFGTAKRRLLSVLLFVTVVGGFGLALYSGASPYGFGNFVISRIMQAIHGWNMNVLISLSAIWLLVIVFILIGSVIAKRALLHAPPATSKGSYHRPRKTTNVPYRIALDIILRSIWRTTESRKPLIAIVVFGIPAMIASPLTSDKALGLAVAIPLTVALSWSVNAFAILGTGMSWMTSQPRIIKHLPMISFALQMIVNVSLLGILWSVAFFFHNTSLVDGLFILRNSLLAMFGTAALSMYLSINHPIRAQLAGRGNALIPPLTALGYLVQLIFIASVPLVLISLNIPAIQKNGALGTILVAELFWLMVQQRRWGDAQIRARVVQIVSAQ